MILYNIFFSFSEDGSKIWRKFSILKSTNCQLKSCSIFFWNKFIYIWVINRCSPNIGVFIIVERQVVAEFHETPHARFHLHALVTIGPEAVKRRVFRQ